MLAASAPSSVSELAAQSGVPPSCGAQLEHHNQPLLRPRRPGDRRRRPTTSCCDELRAIEEAEPGAAHAGLADPAGRRRRRWSASSRSSTPSRCSRSPTPATRRSCGPGRRGSRNHLKRLDIAASRVQLHDRAEDRRPGDLADLRGRGLRPRRHPRRRPGRRGRDPEPAHDRRDPAADRGRAASWSRCAARSTCRSPTSKRSTSAAPRRASRPSPTRATRPPARSASSTRRWPPNGRSRSGATGSARVRGLDLATHMRGARVAARARLQGQSRHRPPRRASTRSSSAAAGGRSGASRSTTRSTASSSRSTSGRCGGSWAWSGASRAGRSPGSSRRRRRRRR